MSQFHYLVNRSPYNDDSGEKDHPEFLKNIRLGYPEVGVYKRKLEKARELGIKFLNTMKKNKFGKFANPAVMFDIDETLSYYGVPLNEIIDIYRYCRKLGLKIIIITARAIEGLQFTKNELKSLGVKYDHLILRKSTDDIMTFKNKCKQQLADNNNINIIMSIGDNWIDVDGDCSGYALKLPGTTDDYLYHTTSKGQISKIM